MAGFKINLPHISVPNINVPKKLGDIDISKFTNQINPSGEISEMINQVKNIESEMPEVPDISSINPEDYLNNM